MNGLLTSNSSLRASNYDFLIVGQGIAGTVLAQTLIQRGKAVLVIDAPDYSSSSKVAAGLYNPIVFKRLTKSWMIDELLPVAEKFYTGLERVLSEKFFYKKKIVKLFAEENEKVFWKKKAQEENLKKYLSPVIEEIFLTDVIESPNGAATVLEAGNVDVKKMLNSFREYLKKNKLLIEERISYADISISGEHVTYKGVTAKKIIFCEGFRAIESPYFNWLPFKLTKGEIITIKLTGTKGIDEELVINKGVFILPLGDHIYKVGATHNWDQLNETPTEKGKAELIEKLDRILKVPYEIIDHEAGVRPTVSDRRPMLGLHPDHKNIGIFNGLGTKGVMLAPYFAIQLIESIENGKKLDKEVDILRFRKV